MKLNMGCGFNRKEGFVNVDMYLECKPDILMDLESTPWGFDSDSVDEMLFNHSLEHLGADPRVFLKIFQEIYRVCKKDAVIQIYAPHPRHDNFICDPTHVRVITPRMLSLFSRKLNLQWKEQGASNSPLALYLNVDFEVVEVVHVLEKRYADLHQSRKIRDEELNLASRERNNVVSEYVIKLRVIK